MLGFNPTNINHELCHYTDHVTYMLGFNPTNINHELCHHTDHVTYMLGFNPTNIVNLNSQQHGELQNPILKTDRAPHKPTSSSALPSEEATPLKNLIATASPLYVPATTFPDAPSPSAAA
jgi:hypothetical protein